MKLNETEMKLCRLVALCVFALGVFPAARAQVNASLVTADSSVQPGRPFTVALRLEHAPSWHTYWINAGIGYPTSITWELPAGWTASDIHWPVPILISNTQGEVTGHGYEGTVYLPVTVTSSKEAKPGEEVTLKAAAAWLMCAIECIPSGAQLSLNLPVFAVPPKPDQGVRAELAKMAMPQPPSGWTVSASKSRRSVTLKLVGDGALSSPHFFSADAFIQYDGPQKISKAKGSLTIVLPIAEDADVSTTRLVGVLAYTDAPGRYRGMQVDVPLGSAKRAAASW